MEKDAEHLVSQDVIVIINKELLNKLRGIFDSCKDKGKEDIDCEVNTLDLIGEISEDTYFSNNLDQVVRESTDGEKETLDGLLERLFKTYKSEKILWHTFLGFFTKRGRIRDGEKINLLFEKKVTQQSSLLENLSTRDNEIEESAVDKEERLKKELK
jgi:hypothetical protein